MKKLHIFIVSLVCSFSALCQNINFYDYCQLHKKGTKIREKQIKLDPRSISKEAILYYFAADYLGIDSSANSYYKASILPKMDIYHLIPTYMTRLNTFEQNLDTLVLGKKRICIQELLSSTNSMYPNVVQISIWEQRGQKIMALVIEHIETYCSYYCNILLFDITDGNNMQAIDSHGYNTVFTSPRNYVGDFNKDGLLDFCFGNISDFEDNNIEENLVLFVFNIIDGQLVRISDIQLSIETVDNIYFIDTLKSKWFYPIKSDRKLKNKVFNVQVSSSYYPLK